VGPGAALAQDVPPPPKSPLTFGTARPSILDGVGIDQKLNAQIPGDLDFRDETGREVHLSDYFGKRPMVLTLVYFQCPMLCTMVLNDVLRTINAMPENVGKDFDILTISFDPADTPDAASRKKSTYVAQYHRPDGAAGWHFLTGAPDSIATLTSTAGFRYVWDAKNQMFAHASGIMVLTPDGRISKYFYGIDYAPTDLRLALVEASGGKIGGTTDQFLLYCFHYDPTTGKYGLAIDRALKAGGVLTVVVLGSLMLVMIRRDRSRAERMNK
jgi:protein SCO1/2